MNPDIAKHKTELELLCRQYHVNRLDLFGSAATGRERPGQSDLDFLVEFETLSPGSYADSYFGLLESLEKLFGRPVDLVVASAIKNPYFRQSVEQTKAHLYAA
ncbi:MAG: nucleotidyltransferase family protein [Nevskiales bacterium]